jgi:hypothetical protein
MFVLDLRDKSRALAQVERSNSRLIPRGVESINWSVEAPWTGCYWDDERVELAFATVALREICESRRRATNLLGARLAYELAQRLADIDAAATVAELANLLPDDIVDRSESERALRIEAGYDLVFCVGHVEIPVLNEGSTDWTRVSRIRNTALEARDG